ncbi:MAG: N-acetylmuramoyl-L-alanine amidase [candidate division KSB1 bacterium]|nr:N-acetylmuramoyl-L-alanine amidase [candidate division KSB1 bacterium]MDZ7301001.1 N-acetylmuramoyl-L-alanine amidase [candidate division KSB1 bacterium]MDZ7310320.1 N-acetylmuramoyl-L-alanine amidase [candidate division KSB1 bacterium]
MQKSAKFSLFFGVAMVVLSSAAPLLAQYAKLEVIYPREGMTVTAAESTFIFGNFDYRPLGLEAAEQPSKIALAINGIPARLYPNKTYLAVVPVKPGPFTFHAVLRPVTEAGEIADSIVVDRNVYIPYYLTTSPSDTLMADTSYVFPSVDLELMPGDVLGVALKATPGCSARFSIDGVAADLPMSEQPPKKNFYWGEAVFGQARPPATPEVRGIYTGVYLIRSQDNVTNATIRFEIADTLGHRLQMIAPGKLTITASSVPRVASLTQELTIARTSPGKGYQLFLPSGVKLWITGREGNFYRARLAEGESVWVPTSSVTFLPAGTQPPQSIIEVVRTKNFAKHTRVTIFLSERLPYKIEQERKPQRLHAIIYGATSDTDWIRHDFGDPLIEEIRWTQEAEGRYRLSIDLNQKQQWGYRAFYENNNLILEIKKSPVIGRSPLRNLLICVDPGHGPDLGAIGPTGFFEKDANYLLAEVVARKLEAKGSRIIFTRVGSEGIALSARTKLAEAAGADVFVSLHHNALPDGVDPDKNRGSSAYYFHPQSYPLAKSILKMMLKQLKLQNYGLFYDNLNVCRVTSMPSVLVEPAFIMHPEEEALILDPGFREKTAEAIVAGIEEFVKAAK